MAETETKQKNPIQWKNILLKTGIILCRAHDSNDSDCDASCNHCITSWFQRVSLHYRHDYRGSNRCINVLS